MNTQKSLNANAAYSESEKYVRTIKNYIHEKIELASSEGKTSIVLDLSDYSPSLIKNSLAYFKDQGYYVNKKTIRDFLVDPYVVFIISWEPQITPVYRVRGFFKKDFISKKIIILSVIAGILFVGAMHVARSGYPLPGCLLAYIVGFWCA